MKITRNSKISLNFSLAVLPSGEEIDNNFDKPAVSFRYGDGSLLPAFEQALLNMQAEDECEFIFSAEDAFGEIREDNIHRIVVSQFKDIVLAEGLMINFAVIDQREVTGVVKTFDEQYAQIDFNHPLAGQKIKFKVRIAKVEEQGIYVEQLEAADNFKKSSSTKS